MLTQIIHLRIQGKLYYVHVLYNKSRPNLLKSMTVGLHPSSSPGDSARWHLLALSLLDPPF